VGSLGVLYYLRLVLDQLVRTLAIEDTSGAFG